MVKGGNYLRVCTIATVDGIKKELVSGRTVIVIDVLRASSTIVTALDFGYASVIAVKTPNEALALRTIHTILAGEIHCKKIEGFDYNNSPNSIKEVDPRGNHLVLTTTNGTKAIENVKNADKVLIGCLLNATACVNEAIKQNRDITVYCAGTRSEFALEDGLAAGLMVHIAKKINPEIKTCDFSDAMEACYLQLLQQIPTILFSTTTGKRLVEHQFTDDILYCGQVDHLKVVPYVKGNRILSMLRT